jgi:small subunit ribosomal protein S9
MATETKEPTVKEVTAKKPAVHAAPRAAAHATGHVGSGRYIEAIGRRKTAIARVRVMKGDGKFSVNGKAPKDYFDLPRLATAALAPLSDLKIDGDYDVSAKVSGGGIHAQAEAIRLGIARAIAEREPERKKVLRASGYLTRDSRMVERKKYGLKKARRRPQWAKR